MREVDHLGRPHTYTHTHTHTQRWTTSAGLVLPVGGMQQQRTDSACVGRYPLHIAAGCGSEEALAMLLKVLLSYVLQYDVNVHTPYGICLLCSVLLACFPA